jgi:hypothetical protein
MKSLVAVCLSAVLFTSCLKSKDHGVEAFLIVKLKFDSTQVRLNNVGQPSTIPAGNAAQSPIFNKMSVHYIELATTANTQIGQGFVLYRATESTNAGAAAIDFNKSFLASNGDAVFSIPISDALKGNFQWLRVSLAYQNYDVKFRVDTVVSSIAFNGDYTGTIASFIGYNTYLTNYAIKNQVVNVNGNKAQGYWGFESNITSGSVNVPILQTGQAPAGSTTVVNPLFATSPIPAGSCVVTAQFTPGNLIITGTETKDIVVEVNLSTNKSFEWKDNNGNGKWDLLKGEQVVDMGIRGMIPKVQ